MEPRRNGNPNGTRDDVGGPEAEHNIRAEYAARRRAAIARRDAGDPQGAAVKMAAAVAWLRSQTQPLAQRAQKQTTVTVVRPPAAINGTTRRLRAAVGAVLGRAPRRASNGRRHGSRRPGASSRTSSTDPGGDDAGDVAGSRRNPAALAVAGVTA